MSNRTNTSQPFDAHADTYDEDLNSALSASGENKQYFAEKRIVWLQQSLQRLGEMPRSAIDYGCGIGDTTALMHNSFRLDATFGLEVSNHSLVCARLRHSSSPARFLELHEYIPQADVDLTYCNGVFHHIPVADRPDAVDYIKRCLRPGGLFAFWENNPWNPGARYVMWRATFDHEAITLSAPEAVRLLQARGFQIIAVSFIFIFPRFLKLFRFMEPYFSKMPLGAQYQVLCRKPLS